MSNTDEKDAETNSEAHTWSETDRDYTYDEVLYNPIVNPLTNQFHFIPPPPQL